MLKKSLVVSFLIIVISFLNASAQTEDEIKSVTMGVVNGKAVSLPKPVYPPAALAVRASGAVNIQVVIDEEGNVITANAVSGHPLLRSSAVEAAQQAKFKPTLISGQAVKVNGVIVYNFVPPPTVTSSENSDDTDEPMKFGIVQRATGSDSSAPVVNGSAINLVKPEYPAAARAVRASGAVNVRVLIDEEGNVVSAEAVSGHPLLRASSVNAASLSTFKPTLLEGKPVKVDGIIVYNFVPPTVENSSSGSTANENSDVDQKPVSGGILNGKALSLIKPKYPSEARAEKAGGAVNVQIIIDEEGNVISAKAVTGHELLREASEKAALGSKFTPTLLEGIPVKVTGVLVYNFVP